MTLPFVCTGLELREAIDALAGILPKKAADWKTLGYRGKFLADPIHQGWAERISTLRYGRVKPIDWPLTPRRYMALTELMLKVAKTPGWDWLWVTYAAASLNNKKAAQIKVDLVRGRFVVEKKFEKTFAPLTNCDRR